jgi:hypothetical protein
MFNSRTLNRIACVSSLYIAAGVVSALYGQNEFFSPISETNFFGGASRFFAYQDAPPRMVLNDGLLAGVRETWNFSRHWAIEGSYQYGQNNLRLTPVPGSVNSSVRFASHTGIGWAGPVFYFQPPERRLRVFLRAGPAVMTVLPTSGAKQNATNPANAYWGATGLNSTIEVGGAYGLGIKYHVNNWLGFRADFEGSAFPEVHFHLPAVPGGPGSVYIPPGGTGTLYTISAGFLIGIGHHKAPAAAILPPPPPPPPARLDVDAIQARAIDAGCVGDTKEVPLAVHAVTSLQGHEPAYAWTVNGQPAGTNSANFAYQVPMTPGTYRVAVNVTDTPGTSTDTRTADGVMMDVATITVRPHTDPTINVAAARNELNLGDSTPLTVTPQGNACNRRMTYSCATTEGTLTGNPTTGFNSTGVAFDTDRSKVQTKQVTVTCTVTDDLGGRATGSAPVSVKLDALAAQRFDDIVFAKNNARVNNCGKRILLEEVYPQLTAHPDWNLVVVGHKSSDEKSNEIDRQRVMNVIAALTAGTDTCQNLDPSRVQYALQGTDQSSQTRPAFCGTSTRAKTEERRGQAVAEDDANAQYRRVEVYLVPRGAAPPVNASALQVVPVDSLKPLGCPR